MGAAVGFPVILKATAVAAARNGLCADEDIAVGCIGSAVGKPRPPLATAIFIWRSMSSTAPHRISGAGDEHGNVVSLGERECSISAASPEADRRVAVP